VSGRSWRRSFIAALDEGVGAVSRPACGVAMAKYGELRKNRLLVVNERYRRWVNGGCPCGSASALNRSNKMPPRAQQLNRHQAPHRLAASYRNNRWQPPIHQHQQYRR